MKKKIEVSVNYSFDWDFDDEEDYDGIEDIVMSSFYDDPSSFDSVEICVDGEKVC